MRKTGTHREAPPDRECDEAVPGCILTQVTPGHRFEFALQGLLGTTYVLTAVTDTFKHLQADDDDVTDSTVEVCLWAYLGLKGHMCVASNA